MLRQYLLCPDEVTNQTFLYCLAVAAAKYDIEVNWTEAMSNHHHTGIYDKHGNYPEFMCYFHSLVGRAMNAYLGRNENFWAAEQANVVELLDAEAEFGKQIYALTNPLKDHLVDKAHNWPGVCSLRYQLGSGEVTVKRPAHFFDPSGELPEEITLKFVRPRAFAHLSDEEWKEMLRAAIAEKERRYAAERKERNIKLVGRKAVRRQSPFSAPKTATKRRRVRPQIASRNNQRRIAALQRNKQFVADYRAAYQAHYDGQDAVFPAGTYQLRIRGFVSCAPLPPS